MASIDPGCRIISQFHNVKDMNICRGTAVDIPQLCELLALLFDQEAEFKPDAELQGAGLRLIIDNPGKGTILVLRDGHSIVAMVNILFTVSTALGGRVAILEDMVVRPEFRARGAGAILLESAISFAKSAGCLRITLLTDNTNEAAQRFYRRHGFLTSEMVPMRLLIEK
jgi:ribosomal protein S18 acetylase RimI-like enzyme